MAAFSSDPVELYVAHIPGDTTEAQIKDYFQTHNGNRTVVESFFVSKTKTDNFVRKDGKKSAIVAIVRMGSTADAMDAKAKLNRTNFNGNLLNVRWSQSQRVLWVGRLHESVTNEQLLSAFGQFGPIQKARVVAEPAKGASKCYGFVVFEGKREATRAMKKCQEECFIIGQTCKPVKVEFARLEDGDGGYSEEMKQNRKLTPVTIDHATISRFLPKNSKEYAMSSRINGLYAEYERMKAVMKSKLVELQNQMVMNPGMVQHVSLVPAIANDPAFSMGVPRPIPGPQPPAFAPRPGYGPAGVRPPQVPPPRAPGQYPVPGPRPPAYAPAAAAPQYGALAPQYGAPAPQYGAPAKRPAEAPLQAPPAKAHAVNYGTGAPSMAQALTYATQQAPADPYAAYQQQQQQQYAPAPTQQAVAPVSHYQQPQAAAPVAAPSQYPGYDTTQYPQQSLPAPSAPATSGYYQDASAGQYQQQQYQGYQ
eukprot:gene14802-20857_t